MSLGLHETSTRRRRQRRWAAIRTLLLAGLLGGGVWISYFTGQQIGEAENEALRQQLEETRDHITELEVENARLIGEVTAARTAGERWRQRYRQEVPIGDVAEMLALIERKLAAGVPLDRIAFVVGTVQRQRDCANSPVSRRFLVRTPIYQGANDSVSFAEGTITVSASGASAKDANGNPEAWFDAAAPVRVTVAQIGGETSEVEGPLPLHFSLVRGDTEHRFTAKIGERRGFVEVTEDRCAYP